MGKLTYTCFITLDNVVDEPHLWSMQFQSPDTGELNDGLLQDADALLLGRITYEGFAGAWPSRSGDPFSDKINVMPKYVVSNSLEQADWHNTTIISGDVVDRIRALKDEGDVLVWGSSNLEQTLADNGLIDEYVLQFSPVVGVKGKKLFRDTGERKLKFTGSTQLSGGMLALRAVPASE